MQFPASIILRLSARSTQADRRISSILHFILHTLSTCFHCLSVLGPSREEIQKKRQRSSLLFEGQNLLNSLPSWLFCIRTILRTATGWFEEKDEFVLLKIVSAARNWINSVPQTAAMTFAFSSVFILLMWVCLWNLLSGFHKNFSKWLCLQIDHLKGNLKQIFFGFCIRLLCWPFFVPSKKNVSLNFDFKPEAKMTIENIWSK